MATYHVCLGRLSEFPALEVGLSTHFVSKVGVLFLASFLQLHMGASTLVAAAPPELGRIQI